MSDTFRILHNIGIDPTSDTSHVRELTAWIEKSGMQYMGVTWGPEAKTADERARALLEVLWEIEHGHTCKTEVMDCHPINRRFNTESMKYFYEFRPDRIMPSLRDYARRFAMHWRIQRDRMFRRRNPFSVR